MHKNRIIIIGTGLKYIQWSFKNPVTVAPGFKKKMHFPVLRLCNNVKFLITNGTTIIDIASYLIFQNPGGTILNAP